MLNVVVRAGTNRASNQQDVIWSGSKVISPRCIQLLACAVAPKRSDRLNAVSVGPGDIVASIADHDAAFGLKALRRKNIADEFGLFVERTSRLGSVNPFKEGGQSYVFEYPFGKDGCL